MESEEEESEGGGRKRRRLDGEEDDFYQQAKQLGKRKKEGRAAARAGPAIHAPLPDVTADGARKVRLVKIPPQCPVLSLLVLDLAIVIHGSLPHLCLHMILLSLSPSGKAFSELIRQQTAPSRVRRPCHSNSGIAKHPEM